MTEQHSLAGGCKGSAKPAANSSDIGGTAGVDEA